VQVIEVHSDGSCLGNPGPGGYAAIIQGPKGEVELVGGDPDTTNNRMEMKAILEAFKYLNKHELSDSVVRVHTDSRLIVNTFKENWKKKENKDLWAEIESEYASLYSAGNSVEWEWVKGHAGHPENERADDLARKQAFMSSS